MVANGGIIMIILIDLLLFTLIAIISYVKFHKLINFIFLFSGLWLFFGAVSSLGVIGGRVPSLEVYFFSWIFVLVVDVLVWCFARPFCSSGEFRNNYVEIKHVYFLQIMNYILLIPLAINMITYLMATGSLVAARNYYFSGEVFSSYYLGEIFKTIPMSMLNAMMLGWVFYSFRMKNYRYLIIAFIDVILISVLNGGRYAILGVLYAIVIMLFSGELKFNGFNFFRIKKYKRYILASICFVVIFMIYITITRGQSLISSIVSYFSGSYAYLDYILDNPSQFALNEKTYGYLTFGSITEPFVIMLKVLGITDAKVPSYEFNIYCQNFYNIGTGTKVFMYNANTSVLYYYLRDFGFLGIIIGAIFFSSCLIYAYNRRLNNTFYSLCFVYVCIALFNSLMTYSLFGTGPLYTIITFWLISQKGIVIRKRRVL